MIKVINREAQKRGLISRRQAITKGRVPVLIEEIGLTGREKLSIDRQKNLSSQSDKAIELIFKRLNYKPKGKFEQALELAQKIGKTTGIIRRVEIINFEALVDYGAKNNHDLNELSGWSFGLTGNNTIVNQNFIPFMEKGVIND